MEIRFRVRSLLLALLACIVSSTACIGFVLACLVDVSILFTLNLKLLLQFSRFRKASDIPAYLIANNKTLRGHVMRVSAQTGALEVKVNIRVIFVYELILIFRTKFQAQLSKLFRYFHLQHKPPISLFQRNRKLGNVDEYLNVNVAGLKLTEEAKRWSVATFISYTHTIVATSH